MPRRRVKADPYDVKRTAARSRLVDEVRMSAAMADQWVRVWEMEAESRDLDRDDQEFWSLGFDWILAQIGKGGAWMAEHR